MQASEQASDAAQASVVSLASKVSVEKRVIRPLHGRRQVVHDARFGSLIEVTAPSPAQARRECIDLAERACTGTYSPIFAALRGNVLVVWREPSIGWTYRIMCPRNPLPPEPLYGSVYFDDAHANDRTYVWAQGVNHLVQTGFDPEREDDDLLTMLREIDSLCPTYYHYTAQFESWSRWQRAYHRARLAGLGDRQCDAYATAYSYGHHTLAQACHNCGIAVFELPEGLSLS